MYTLKSIARRSIALGMAVALFAATVMPTASVFADALNPLTDRSLTLSSGSPGWAFTDGSGNSTYAPPNSGANGQKTGNTFDFKVSTDTTGSAPEYVKTMTFQYCTTPAGNCIGPGDNGYTGTDGVDAAAIANSPTTIAAQTSDLEAVISSPTQIEQAAIDTYIDTASANGVVTSVPAPASAGTNYVVMYYDTNTSEWVSSDDWTMTVENTQNLLEINSDNTDKNNQIRLTNTTGQGFTSGQRVKVIFFGTDSNYITNPGSDEFFVKINTYNSTTLNDTTLVDGGVTVANVMNESIQITTKVLETMDFSVGTVDPYTLEATGSTGSQLHVANGGSSTTHGVCDPILRGMAPADAINTLQMGDENGEFSLETAHTYSTHSYWRLSSNSSAGATIYYSGVTLKNTVGDEIEPINNGTGTAANLQRGQEQFGLAMANDTSGVRLVNYDIEREPGVTGPPAYGVFENGADNNAAGLADALNGGIHSSVTDDAISNVDSNASWHTTGPQLSPIAPYADYDNGAGIVNPEYGTVNTQFAFNEESNTIPTPFADGTEVVDCVTGKMRYIANIAATTPAGIYTTKINYIAAPQY